MTIDKQLIEKLLEKLTKSIKNDNYHFDETSAKELTNFLIKASNNIYDITKREACINIIACTGKEFDVYRKEGLIPPGHKKDNSSVTTWCRNDFTNVLIHKKLHSTQ